MRKKQSVTKEEAVLLLQSQPLSAHLWQIASDDLRENALRFPNPAYLDSKTWPDYITNESIRSKEQYEESVSESGAEIKPVETDNILEKEVEFQIEKEDTELKITAQPVKQVEIQSDLEKEKSSEEDAVYVPELQTKRKYKRKSELNLEQEASADIENEFQSSNSRELKMENATTQSLDFYEWLEELKEINPVESEILPKNKKLKSGKPGGRITKAAQELIDAKTMAENSLTLGEEIVSETLARLLARQGHKEEAIEMYEKLIVKYPEKGATFAAALQKLKS
jgi:hypothetical protein